MGAGLGWLSQGGEASKLEGQYVSNFSVVSHHLHMLQLGILSGGGGQELQHLVKVHLLVIPLSHPCHPFVTSLSSTCHLLLAQVCSHLLLPSSPQPGGSGEDTL